MCRNVLPHGDGEGSQTKKVIFSEAVPARDPAADAERLDVRRREQRRRPPAQDLLPDGRPARQGGGEGGAARACAPLQRSPQHQERRQPRRLRQDNRAGENRRRAGEVGPRFAAGNRVTQ